MYLSYNVRKFITLKIVNPGVNALLCAMFPLLKARTELFFLNAFKRSSSIFLYVLHTLKTMTSEGIFNFTEWKKVAPSEIRWIWWVVQHIHLIFYERVTNFKGRVYGCTVLVKQPAVVCPQLRPNTVNLFAETLEDVQIQLRVHCGLLGAEILYGRGCLSFIVSATPRIIIHIFETISKTSNPVRQLIF